MKICEHELGYGVGRLREKIMALLAFSVFFKMCFSNELAAKV